MPRGFTLFELVISIAVLSILLMAAGPSFTRLLEDQSVKRFAGEIEGFFIQAKSESVLQNKKLNLFYIDDSVSWIISLNPEGSSVATIAEAKNTSLAFIKSLNHPNITMSSSISVLTFDPVRATPNLSRSFYFYKDNNKKLKLSVHNITGRIKLCGLEGAFYGYKKC
ncbi:prepilin-type N-terminal cleavage/methylation domain-containing protein [Aliivibrio fischeri]|uniref:prepilin-type N-terminal cleavage/methylation domain-containing protein n=1 Tax=Aliivibrio fischeri TaxID=668 RepID=UPI00166548C8|nr:prepilin-type N-terminal cleavage/methylation domain-containing protein [Aliivibrio fischeri]USR96038.1 prepilin-type N-terminal cleavage/methylation domain-containing protein [Aliivibrio fischeri ATCC 7744 = JCM 18803 = DSM 507]GGK51248.1 general secretion pathway protein GspH [Aliivibrio fischeri]